jgi:hypothetical protein
MWWGLLIGICLVMFIVETVEERWLYRKARKDLSIMRTYVHSGRPWNAARGDWQA